jgi:hypothetical protein
MLLAFTADNISKQGDMGETMNTDKPDKVEGMAEKEAGKALRRRERAG